MGQDGERRLKVLTKAQMELETSYRVHFAGEIVAEKDGLIERLLMYKQLHKIWTKSIRRGLGATCH